jgi:cytochrome P450
MTSRSFGRFIVCDIESTELQAMMAACGAFQDGFASQFSLRAQLGSLLPTSSTLRFLRVMKRLHQALQQRIALRRGEPEPGDDFLGHLLNHRDENGQPLDDRLIRDELITLFFAGSETTALVLSWGLYLIAGHPEIHDRAVEEMAQSHSGNSKNAEASPPVALLTNIVRESIRLYPPSWVVGREATQPCDIAGYHCRKGDTFMMSPWVVQRHSRQFNQPECFDPDRWNHASIRDLPRFAYFPFGGGPRVCPGRSFAELAAAQSLALMLQNHRLSPVAEQPAKPYASITLQPRDGILLMVSSNQIRAHSK